MIWWVVFAVWALAMCFIMLFLSGISRGPKW